MKSIYLAAPISMYDTAAYDAALAQLNHCMPGWAILPCRGLYEDAQAWRELWPTIAHTLVALAFITDGDGFIGKALAEEITTMRAQRKPVFYLTATGELLPGDGTLWVLSPPPDLTNWQQWQQLTRMHRPSKQRKGGKLSS